MDLVFVPRPGACRVNGSFELGTARFKNGPRPNTNRLFPAESSVPP